jgi:hypothetical protein
MLGEIIQIRNSFYSPRLIFLPSAYSLAFTRSCLYYVTKIRDSIAYEYNHANGCIATIFFAERMGTRQRTPS